MISFLCLLVHGRDNAAMVAACSVCDADTAVTLLLLQVPAGRVVPGHDPAPGARHQRAGAGGRVHCDRGPPGSAACHLWLPYGERRLLGEALVEPQGPQGPTADEMGCYSGLSSCRNSGVVQAAVGLLTAADGVRLTAEYRSFCWNRWRAGASQQCTGAAIMSYCCCHMGVTWV